MFGEGVVYRAVDRLRGGFAQGFIVRSDATGTVSSIKVYLGRHNRANMLRVALYSDPLCRPGVRLAAGSRRHLARGRWNTVRVPAVRVGSGHTYRIMVAGAGGALEVRDHITKRCVRDVAAQRPSRAWPSKWKAGSHQRACAISAYAEGATINHGTLTSSPVSGGSGAPVVGSGSGGPGVSSQPVLLVPTVYVAQDAAGSNDGSSCANAHSVDWFNASSSWGAAQNQIGPGAVVGLCGTISSGLVAQGSGTPAAPITIYWLPGTTMSSPNWGGGTAFDTNGQSYLTLDGGLNGSIQATELGTGLADQGQFARAITASDCTGCTFEFLTIANFYVHTSSSDTSVDQTQDNAIVFSGSGITIANNTIHDVGWALYAEWNNGDGNDRIHNNNIYNIDHGFSSTAGFTGGDIGPIYFYDNEVHDFANWDTNNDTYHHDGIHCYTVSNQTGAAHYSGLYIYNNLFGGSVGNNTTADIFMEGNYGNSGATPCSDASSSIYIFNNVLTSTDTLTDNPYIADYGGDSGIYDNTVIGHDNTTSLGGCATYQNQPPGATASFKNNLLSTCDNLIGGDPSDYTSGNPDYNLYANGGSNSFVCSGNFYNFSQFSSWQSCMGADSHSRTVANANLNSDGSLQAGSPAVGAGTNLTSLCGGQSNPGLGALCENIDGAPRPTTGAWNAGAY